MSKSAAIGSFVAVAVLALVMIIIYQFGFMSTASTDLGVNLSGTSYQEAYNYSGNTSRVAFASFSFVPVFLGVLALVSALMLILYVGMKRR